MTNIQKDQFLSSKFIKVQRSNYLKNHYAQKSLKLKDTTNPRDPFGSRLSHYWEQGDTVKSVTLKRMKHIISTFFNPDTYSFENLKSIRSWMVKEKVKLIGGCLCIFVPVCMIYPYIMPRLMKVRRQYLFQYYLQDQMLARQLNTKTKKIPKQQMEEILKNINSRIKF